MEFRRGEVNDFERMLDTILRRGNTKALQACNHVQSEFAMRGMFGNSRTALELERCVTTVHEETLTAVIWLIIEFAERSGISTTELSKAALEPLMRFTADIVRELTTQAATAARGNTRSASFNVIRENLGRLIETALKDVEFGFVDGRSVNVSTVQENALRLLKAIYDETRTTTEPQFIANMNTGLSKETQEAAWRYLKDRGLIETFAVPYTARINAAGTDAIEGATTRPDQTSTAFPLARYSSIVVNNTLHVQNISNSAVQQGGGYSTQNQTIAYNVQESADLNRLLREIGAHLDELGLEARQRQRAEKQIATLSTELADSEPNAVIIREAGRTLRNITEGAIGSLIASQIDSTVWPWMLDVMHRLFP
jgi:hypothetical protein